jgi:hypothetical protein
VRQVARRQQFGLLVTPAPHDQPAAQAHTARSPVGPALLVTHHCPHPACCRKRGEVMSGSRGQTKGISSRG